MPSALVIPFPFRRTLSQQDRALVARWTSAARPSGIAHVYLSARQEDDPTDVHDRILIVETPGAGAAWVIHRPDRRWIVMCGRDLEETGSYAALGDALNAIRPLLSRAV